MKTILINSYISRRTIKLCEAWNGKRIILNPRFFYKTRIEALGDSQREPEHGNHNRGIKLINYSFK